MLSSQAIVSMLHRCHTCVKILGSLNFYFLLFLDVLKDIFEINM